MTAERADAGGGAPHVRVRVLDAAGLRSAASELAALLVATVDGGGSIGFMAPLGAAEAAGFWAFVADESAAGRRTVFVAQCEGVLAGCVQLVPAQAPNQPHRADVAKLMVLPPARGRGVAAALVRALETAARAAGRRVLVLDTQTGGAAERLYARLGWSVVGRIPGYALTPSGELASTTYFFKSLE